MVSFIAEQSVRPEIRLKDLYLRLDAEEISHVVCYLPHVRTLSFRTLPRQGRYERAELRLGISMGGHVWACPDGSVYRIVYDANFGRIGEYDLEPELPRVLPYPFSWHGISENGLDSPQFEDEALSLLQLYFLQWAAFHERTDIDLPDPELQYLVQALRLVENSPEYMLTIASDSPRQLRASEDIMGNTASGQAIQSSNLASLGSPTYGQAVASSSSTPKSLLRSLLMTDTQRLRIPDFSLPQHGFEITTPPSPSSAVSKTVRSRRSKDVPHREVIDLKDPASTPKENDQATAKAFGADLQRDPPSTRNLEQAERETSRALPANASNSMTRDAHAARDPESSISTSIEFKSQAAIAPYTSTKKPKRLSSEPHQGRMSKGNIVQTSIPLVQHTSQSSITGAILKPSLQGIMSTPDVQIPNSELAYTPFSSPSVQNVIHLRGVHSVNFTAQHQVSFTQPSSSKDLADIPTGDRIILTELINAVMAAQIDEALERDTSSSPVRVAIHTRGHPIHTLVAESRELEMEPIELENDSLQLVGTSQATQNVALVRSVDLDENPSSDAGFEESTSRSAISKHLAESLTLPMSHDCSHENEITQHLISNTTKDSQIEKINAQYQSTKEPALSPQNQICHEVAPGPAQPGHPEDGIDILGKSQGAVKETPPHDMDNSNVSFPDQQFADTEVSGPEASPSHEAAIIGEIPGDRTPQFLGLAARGVENDREMQNADPLDFPAASTVENELSSSGGVQNKTTTPGKEISVLDNEVTSSPQTIQPLDLSTKYPSNDVSIRDIPAAERTDPPGSPMTSTSPVIHTSDDAPAPRTDTTHSRKRSDSEISEANDEIIAAGDPNTQSKIADKIRSREDTSTNTTENGPVRKKRTGQLNKKFPALPIYSNRTRASRSAAKSAPPDLKLNELVQLYQTVTPALLADLPDITQMVFRKHNREGYISICLFIGIYSCPRSKVQGLNAWAYLQPVDRPGGPSRMSVWADHHHELLPIEEPYLEVQRYSEQLDVPLATFDICFPFNQASCLTDLQVLVDFYFLQAAEKAGATFDQYRIVYKPKLAAHMQTFCEAFHKHNSMRVDTLHEDKLPSKLFNQGDADELEDFSGPCTWKNFPGKDKEPFVPIVPVVFGPPPSPSLITYPGGPSKRRHSRVSQGPSDEIPAKRPVHQGLRTPLRSRIAPHNMPRNEVQDSPQDTIDLPDLLSMQQELTNLLKAKLAEIQTVMETSTGADEQTMTMIDRLGAEFAPLNDQMEEISGKIQEAQRQRAGNSGTVN